MNGRAPFYGLTPFQDDETDLLYYGYRYYAPTTGRWLSRDPINEIGFRNVAGHRRLHFNPRKDESPYRFVVNDPSGYIDICGLAEGYFRINHWNVPIHGGEARRRNVNDGGTVPGFSVKYLVKNCSCDKKYIVIVQAISHNNKAVWDAAPQIDSSATGSLPGAYDGAHNGNLQIFDSPWNAYLLSDTTYTIEDCALCRDGSSVPEKILGCVKFTWTNQSHILSPEGSVAAGEPSSLWNDALNTWNRSHSRDEN